MIRPLPILLCLALSALLPFTPAADDLDARLADFRDLRLADTGVVVTEGTWTLGHLELRMHEGVVVPVRSASGLPAGFFFEGQGSYTYVAEDPADRAILTRNVERTKNRDLLGQFPGTLEDRVERALILTARPREADLPAGARTVQVDDGMEKAVRKIFKRVERTYLEFDHFAVEARANDHGRYAYVEMDGRYETVGYTFDRMRAFGEHFFSFRKISGYDLRFFETLSRQLIDGGPNLNPPPAVMTHADFDVETRDNENVRIVVDQTFRANRRLDVLTLLLDNNADPTHYDWASERYLLAVKDARDAEGRPLRYSHRYHEVLVELPETVEAGETFGFRFELGGDYIAIVPKERNWDLFSFHGRSWYPTPFGWNARNFTMNLRLAVKKPWVPVASGTRVSLEEEGELNVLRTRSERTVRLIGVFAGHYAVVEQTFGDLTIRTYGLAQYGSSRWQDDSLENLGELANGMIEFYGQQLSPYPFDSLDIVWVPLLGGGVAPSGMVLMDMLGSRGRNSLLAHELAHQWFGHRVAPASSRDRWLSESFAEYASGLALATLAGRDRSLFNFADMHRQWWDDTITARDEGPIAAADSLDGDGAAMARYRLLYSKGPLVLRMLHAQVGNDRFYAMLRQFLDEADYGFATTDDFRKVAEAAVGEELGWYFSQWIEEGGLPEIKVKHKIRKKKGKALLIGTAELLEGTPFKKLPIPLVLEYDAARPEVRWVTFDAPTTEFEFELDAAPDKVKVDPARNILALFK